MAGSIRFGIRVLITRLFFVCASFASIMALLSQIGPLLTQWRGWNATLVALGRSVATISPVGRLSLAVPCRFRQPFLGAPAGSGAIAPVGSSGTPAPQRP